MSDSHQHDRTLPSLRETREPHAPCPHYELTLVFHADNGRIGQRTALRFTGGRSLALGRAAPVFAAPGAGPGRPLEDPYVSRRALVVRRSADGLCLSRPPQSSRCRVAGREVATDLYLTDEELDRGVPMILAHCVVLLLRRVVRGVTVATLPDCGLVGGSAVLQDLRCAILRAAGSDRDVLIRGETGTGKELVAAAVHRHSPRAGGPFVAVNMAAIPPPLAAASLFGSVRGAYTGAARAQEGYFRSADGGTLFLDEVGDTPEDVQPLLLRALQEREIQCVGGAVQRVDVRVISASDADLEDAGNGFRAALRHRLGAIRIELPPLREHPEDIGELLLHFLRDAARREGRSALLPDEDSEARVIARWADLFHAFAGHSWPGNVRELANCAGQVVLAGEDLPVLPDALRAAPVGAPPRGAATAKVSADEHAAPARRVQEITDAEFREAMENCRYEIAAVADALGISRQSVYRRVQGSPHFRLVADVTAAELQQALDGCGGELSAAAAALKVSETALRSRLRATGRDPLEYR